MGSLIIVYLLFPSIVILLLALTHCRNLRIRNKARQAIDRIFFNSILLFLEETYLVTTVCCFVNLWYIIDAKQYFELHSIIAYVALLIVIIYPLIIFYLNLRPDNNKLQSEKFKGRVGVIYEDLNFK